MLATGEIPAGSVELFRNHCAEARIVGFEMFENNLGNKYRVHLHPDNTGRFSVNALCIIARFDLRLVEQPLDWDTKRDW